MKGLVQVQLRRSGYHRNHIEVQSPSTGLQRTGFAVCLGRYPFRGEILLHIIRRDEETDVIDK